jgi:hypothetical protein
MHLTRAISQNTFDMEVKEEVIGKANNKLPTIQPKFNPCDFI